MMAKPMKTLSELHYPMISSYNVISEEWEGWQPAWNRVSMIASVKKFGRARLSTDSCERNMADFPKQKAFVKYQDADNYVFCFSASNFNISILSCKFPSANLIQSLIFL